MELPTNNWHPLKSQKRTTGILSQLILMKHDASIPEANANSVAESKVAETIAPIQRVAALLVLSREPLSSRKIAQIAGLEDATQARTLVRELNERFDRQERAIRIEEVAGGFQMLTRPQFAKWLRRIVQTPESLSLTPPLLETLAVIAYRQPVLRADIEAIRGVGCSEMLRQLMDRDFVRIVGRSEDLGRPYLYGTTRRFLQIFGIRSLDRLPKARELRVSGPIFDTPVDETQTSNENVVS